MKFLCFFHFVSRFCPTGSWPDSHFECGSGSSNSNQCGSGSETLEQTYSFLRKSCFSLTLSLVYLVYSSFWVLFETESRFTAQNILFLRWLSCYERSRTFSTQHPDINKTAWLKGTEPMIRFLYPSQSRAVDLDSYTPEHFQLGSDESQTSRHPTKLPDLKGQSLSSIRFLPRAGLYASIRALPNIFNSAQMGAQHPIQT